MGGEGVWGWDRVSEVGRWGTATAPALMFEYSTSMLAEKSVEAVPKRSADDEIVEVNIVQDLGGGVLITPYLYASTLSNCLGGDFTQPIGKPRRNSMLCELVEFGQCAEYLASLVFHVLLMFCDSGSLRPELNLAWLSSGNNYLR